MAEAVVPGLAIAVVGPDSTWIRAYGVSEAAGGNPVSGETIFEAASLSKPLFARMVLAEADRGTIDLDTPLGEYWDYPDLQGDPWSGEITARMVLSHSSGLPNWRRDQPLAIQFKPGERFQYSGEGYVYLEETLAHLRGAGLEERAQEMLIAPSGMAHSSFVFNGSETDHARPHDAHGETQQKRPAAPPGNPAASLHTTAADYGRFIQMLLSEIQADPKRLTRVTDQRFSLGAGLGP